MKSLLKISLVASIVLVSANAQDVNNIDGAFSNGEVSGQIRLGFYQKNPDKTMEKTQSVTAVGGQLKYETASLNGFSAGVAMYASQSIGALSGKQEDGKFSPYLTSSEKSYTELAEAYINYSIDDFNVRIGRQAIDTPLSDCDDVYMTPNTFEAVVASYELKDLGLTFLGANVQRMQGGDADYQNVIDNNWKDTGDSSTNMAALLYLKNDIEASAWYYDIGKEAKAFYVDASKEFEIFPYHHVTISAQYLNENEENDSNFDGSIAGIMLEANYYSFTTMFAYNDVDLDTGKTIFEGFGGGCSFTNMETTTAGSLGFDSKSYVVAVGYDISNINIFAAYGDFESTTDNLGHMTEVDAGVSYSFNDNSDISFVYVDAEDKLATNSGADEIKVFANYNF